MLPTFRIPFLSLGAAAILLAGCAGRAQLDPFGRPYSGDDNLSKGTVMCNDPHVDVQPSIVRGNWPPIPIENAFTGRNAEATVVYRVSPTGVVEVVSVDGADKWFRNHTIIAVRDWKMAPATRGGVPVEAECKHVLRAVFRGYEDAPPNQDNQ